jgi:outer membrane protein
MINRHLMRKRTVWLTDLKQKGMMLLALLLAVNTVWSQQDVLEDYINQGLQSNSLIKQRNLSLENAMYALKKAKANYIPTLNFEGIYTTAEGGRSYEIPVGDYINPFLSMINQFLGPNSIDLLQNEKINFLPKNYYDARIRLAVPILNMDIIHNNRIQQKQMQISENEVEIFARELVKEIKTSYYNYLSVQKVMKIHQNAIVLAEESKRINEKLVEAGKGVYAYVLRSETEIEQLQSKLRAAELQANSLKHYFNALLNRDLNSEIIVLENETIIPFLDKSVVNAQEREELKTLDQVIELRQDLVNMNKQVFVPKLSGFADVGSQAEKMRMNKESFYYMVGLQLTIPIFNGTKTHYDIQRAKNDIEIAKLQKEDVERKLEVAVNAAYNTVLTEQTNYEASLKQLEMAETYHRLIAKGYEAGVNTYIETVDARTQLSSAQIAVNVNYYQLLSALAKLERETAKYQLPSFETHENKKK